MMSENIESREPISLDDERAERLSRFLALVLRHRAPQFDLRMDDEGFVHIDDLLDVIDERQRSLDWVEAEHLEFLTRNQGRKRFEIRDDRIRATYGHSFRRPIRYDPVDPPSQLYLGMSKGRLAEVRMGGLRPKGRQYVHLSEDREEAMEVGRHQGDDVTLVTVRAEEAAKNGTVFYRPTEGLFLTARVDAAYLDLELMYGRSARKTRRRR